MRPAFTLGLWGLVFGCSEPLVLEPPPKTDALDLGESRVVDLRFLRLDVENFGRSLSMADLRQLPPKTLEDTWLFDLDARPLVENALARFVFLPADEAYALEPAAQNMFYLLNMTPENTRLEGTKLAELAAIGTAVGISPSRILADLLAAAPNERVAPIDVVADVVLERIIATHPRARLRQGPATDQNPTGLYPVPPGFIAVSLADIAMDFGTLAERFGPADMHPGFIQSVSGISVAKQNFEMTVRVSVNALPFKGIEASRAAEASVNSMGMQIDEAFDFGDPQWMTIEGLGENLHIGQLVMNIEESDERVAMGKSKNPRPLGDSPVWSEPPWVIEALLADVGRRIAAKIPAHCTTYSPAGQVDPPFDAVEVCIDADGWVEIRVDPSVVLSGPPPAGAYLSDMLLDVAQTRLHDGGLEEGEANVVMPVEDVPIGVKTADIVTRIRTNLENSPVLLRGVAEAISDTTRGDADFFYVQPEGTVDDWLFFVAPEDIRKDETGEPVRPYAYHNPGFYRDASLRTKISSRESVDGDTTHEKVRIRVDDTLYMQDADGAVFEIRLLEKPSARRIRLEVKRVF